MGAPTKQQIHSLIHKFLESNDVQFRCEGGAFVLPQEELYRILNDIIAIRDAYEQLLHVAEHVPVVQASMRARAFITDFTVTGLRPRECYPDEYPDEGSEKSDPELPVVIFPVGTGGATN